MNLLLTEEEAHPARGRARVSSPRACRSAPLRELRDDVQMRAAYERGRVAARWRSSAGPACSCRKVYGGADFGYRGLGQVLEAVRPHARRLAARLATALCARAAPARGAGNDAQKADVFCLRVARRRVSCSRSPLDERPAARAPSAVSTSRDVLQRRRLAPRTAARCFVLDGHVADWPRSSSPAPRGAVDADPQGFTLFLVDPATRTACRHHAHAHGRRHATPRATSHWTASTLGADRRARQPRAMAGRCSKRVTRRRARRARRRDARRRAWRPSTAPSAYLKLREQFGAEDWCVSGAQAPRRADVLRTRADPLGRHRRARRARHRVAPMPRQLASLAKARACDMLRARHATRPCSCTAASA
jgi:hypothetical protein